MDLPIFLYKSKLALKVLPERQKQRERERECQSAAFTFQIPTTVGA